MFNCYLIAAVFIILFFVARKAKPAINKRGGKIQAPNSPIHSFDTLKVATYNIQTGKNLQGKRDITRSAKIIQDNHLVGAQEVYATTWLNRVGLGKSQTDKLNRNGNFIALFCATRLRWFREHRGNALFSQLSINSWNTTMLPDQSGKSYRNMTSIHVTFQDRDVVFINTHLHTKHGREEQLDIVLAELCQT